MAEIVSALANALLKREKGRQRWRQRAISTRIDIDAREKEMKIKK